MITQHKHISMRGNSRTVTEHYAPIVKYTRAGNNGKRIKCPICGHTHRSHGQHLLALNVSQVLTSMSGW